MKPKQLYKWVTHISKSWTGLSRHFHKNVADFSRGVVLAQRSHLRGIAGVVGGNANSQRRRLQRFVQRSNPLEAFFAHWTRSVLEAVPQQEVVLIVDETKLQDRFGVMVVGLAVAERCIPLAWRIYRANDAQAYPVEGQVQVILTLLRAIQPGLSPQQPVRVLADRGIGTSPTLMRGIIELEWTFLFRVTKRSKIILEDGQDVCFYEQVQQAGERYCASGLVFKRHGRVPAHVRVLWAEDATEPWALVTNDARLSGWEYAQRNWIEQAFRDLKSQGWQVEKVLVTCPHRLSQLWIILVVAYGWMLLWGISLQAAGLTLAKKRTATGGRVRQWSLFREGRMAFLTAIHPT